MLVASFGCFGSGHEAFAAHAAGGHIEQFEGGLRSLDISLDDATLSRLDEIFPGYRPAPEEYAW